MTTMSHVVVGLGQIGSALQKIMNAIGHDPIQGISAPSRVYDVLHICFPYSKSFVKTVKTYQKQFSPTLTVIHSTVPVGTSAKCNATHSPIRGIHPELEQGIRTFVKFVGGPEAAKVAEILSQFGLTCQIANRAEDTEAMKLWDTLQYGVNIAMEKEVYDYCKKHGLDFDIVYTKANQLYNEGYQKLGKPQFTKYVLRHVDGKIGGHCVVSNCDLIKTESAKRVKRINKKL